MNSPLLPLSPNQLDILHDQQIYIDSPLYNIGGQICIEGEVDVDILRQAINQLIEADDSLKLLFVTKGSDVFQQIGHKDFPEMEFIDFSEQTNARAEISTWLSNTFKVPFNLDGQHYLFHYALLKESNTRYYLMGKYHHLISDGLSSKVASDRISTYYNALYSNSPCELKFTSYLNFIESELSYIDSPQWKKDAEFWEKTLPELPQPLIEKCYPALDTSKQLLSNKLPDSTTFRFFLDAEFYTQLNAFTKEHKSSSYHLLLVVLSIYFNRISEQDAILIGVPSLNRKGKAYRDALGLFVSLSPLSIKLNREMSIAELLSQCGQSLRNVYRHQRFPLGQITKRLELMRHKRNVLFDLLVSYERQEYATNYAGAKITGQQLFSGVARYPLAVTICEFHQGQGVEIICEGANNIFTASDLELFGLRIKSLLSQIITISNVTVSDLDILIKADHQFIFNKFNQLTSLTTKSSSDDSSLKAPEVDSIAKESNVEIDKDFIQLFSEKVEKYPDSIALDSHTEKLTYAQLDVRTNQLAHHLMGLGADKEVIIGLWLPRSVEMIVAILAILKSGAAYLPVDFNWPLPRVKNILHQSQVLLTITISDFIHRLDYLQQESITLELLSHKLDKYPTSKPTHEAEPNDLAYVIFTSGSTGQPKGVMIERGALATRLKGIQNLFNVQYGDRMGQNIAYNFDPSIIEIFLPLMTGATLVLAPENCHSEQELSEFVVTKNINYLALVPSSLQKLMLGLKHHPAHQLKTVCSGGETLSPFFANDFTQQTGTNLFNVYGPTEATVLASYWHWTFSNARTVLPIGIPIQGTQIYIVDNQCELLPIGVSGEIVIAGSGLARGYLGETELSEDKFKLIRIPLNSNMSETVLTRVYLTGDLGYIKADGLLYFSGRKDSQLKISGYRIEPGEIETILVKHELVNRAVIKVTQHNEHKRLLAYVETEHANIDALCTELSGILRQQLPAYMQPAVITGLEQFPVTNSGKIDIEALPVNTGQTISNFEAAETDMEKRLLSIWQETLKIQKIGIHDNFFALGGDSLAAVSLIAQLDKLTKTKQALSLLLEYPSIFQMAKKLSYTYSFDNLPMLSTLSFQSTEEYNKKNVDLFLMASGHGDTLRFRKLAEELEHCCTLHMLEPSPVSGIKTSINELAKDYAHLILTHNSHPEYIGGFSIAGITALATAKILAEEGKPVKGVILIDTLYPRAIFKATYFTKFLSIMAKILFFNSLVINGRTLNAMLEDVGIRKQLEGLKKHKVESYDGDVAILISSKIRPKHWLFSPWSKVLTDKLKKIPITGLHGSIFHQKNIKTLAKAIENYIFNFK